MSWSSGQRLRLLEGPESGRSISLESKKLKIGRQMKAGGTPPRDCIWIDDGTISKVHAELKWNEWTKGYVIHHRSETNFTRVNGEPITKHNLVVGDRIGMGSALIELQKMPIPASRTSAPTIIIPAVMHCPRDRTALTRATLREVPFERCAQCNGAWMQPGKLSRIHGHPVDLPGAVAVENSKPVDCPQCSNPMGRAFLPGTGGAEAIRCETCQGLWLEGDGLKDVLIAIQKAHGEISVISLGPPTAVVVAPPAPEAPKEVPPPAVTTAPQRAALLDQLRKTRPAPPPQDLEQLPAPALVEGLLREATEAGASDIHIEGTRDQVRVRFRVDGELRAAHLWPKSVHLPLISRLQSLCGVDATEGRFTTQEHDFRVAVVPSQLGPACVIRVLSLSRGIPAVDELGLHPHDLQRVRKVLTHPHGFILATGPTGSGKTTTLFSLLKALGRAKMVTIEDPVDYRLDDVVQVAVDARAGLHFADGLRSLLRLDPDAILVGEMRDQETAQTAVQAALAGRLLLSTLNTQGAAGSITRLLDMGIEPYLVKEVVHCVIGQRLVRLLCPHCRVEHSPSISEMALFGVDPGETVPPIGGAAGRGALEGMQFFKPLGCAQCGQSGYRGRTAVMEVLVNSEAISQAIARRADTREIRQLAMEEGMRSLQQNAFAKYAQGQTSFAEIHQVLG